MPSWRIHLKWAKLFGIRQSVAEFANRIIDDPKSIPIINGTLKELIGHDWGKKSKIFIQIQSSLMSQLYGDEGVWAIELHHLLDHLAHLCNPKKLAQEEVFKKVSQVTSGMALQDRTEIMREVLKGRKIKADVSNIPDKDKDYIVNRLSKKASKLRVSNEVWEFILTHLDQILADIKSDVVTRQ